LQASNWIVTERVHRWLTLFHSRIIGSQVCEDGLKDCRQLEHDNQNRKASGKSSFNKLITGNTLDVRHRYKQPKRSGTRAMRGATLPDEAYHASTKTNSVDLSTIKGSTSKTAWFSTNAERSALPFADLSLLRMSHDAASNTFKGLDFIWMNTIADCHDIIIRRIGSSDKFMLPLGSFCDSACIVVSIDVGEVPGLGTVYYLPTGACSVETVSIMDFTMWEGIPLAWLPPLEQDSKVQLARSSAALAMGLRAISDTSVLKGGGTLPLLQLAA
jgi:hypothetical protein